MRHTKASLKFVRLQTALNTATEQRRYWERQQYELRKLTAAAFQEAFAGKKGK